MHEVALSKDLFARLQKLAVPLVDTPADVIERLIRHYEKGRSETLKDERGSESTVGRLSSVPREAKIAERAPRERGATIEINGHLIRAISVKEMYEEVLKYLLDEGYSKRFRDLMPFSTSSLRYLIAEKPIHPSGKEFYYPVEHHGYYMEAHKSYKTAIKDLSRFVGKMGLKLKYLG